MGAQQRRAVVLGGGMAGLLAAHVLTEQDLEVQVLDRDDLTDDRARRRGVPQGRHVHTLLPRGRQILEELFPGLTSELIAAGATSGDLLGDTRITLSGHRLARAPADLLSLSLSRTMLEGYVRSRVRQRPNVTFGAACDVVGLVGSPDRRRITGVRVLRRADGSADEVIGADLVVDATGHGSRLPVWLEALGCSAPSEDRIEVDVGYATRLYRLPWDTLDGDWGALRGPTAASPRGGVIARREDTWIVTLFGMVGDHPPTDHDGFLAFARSLKLPGLLDAIEHADPISDAIGFRFPASVRRRYERLRDLPDGIIPLGDALCSLDPIYAQGMTMAGLSALLLRDQLRSHGRASTSRYLGELAKVVDVAWEIAAGADLSIPDVRGPRSTKVRLGGAYMARLHAAAAHDPRLAVAFVRVMAMVDPPTALFHPRVVARVLRPRRRRSEATDRAPARQGQT